MEAESGPLLEVVNIKSIFPFAPDCGVARRAGLKQLMEFPWKFGREKRWG